MKAKIKPLIILIAVFMVSLIGGVIAGCSIGEETPDEFAEKRNLTCPVTYYTNGGNFKLGSDFIDGYYRTMYFAPETPILNITDGRSTTSSPPLSIGRDGYVFLGWKYCKLEDGKPVLSRDQAGNDRLGCLDSGSADMRDGDGVQLRETQKVFYARSDPDKPKEVFADGNVFIHSDEHLYLVAEWEKDVEIKYVLDIGEGETMKVNVGETEEEWEDGKIISATSFARFSTLAIDPSKEPDYNVDIPEGKEVDVTTHSYIGLYRQKGGVEPIIKSKNDTFQKPADKQDIIIYARFFEGTDWSSVRDADDFKSMLSNTVSNTRYFIVNDIDCKDENITPKGSGTFRASIYGNNCTVSNIKVPRQVLGNGQEISLFGKIASGVKIQDLTIENIEYTDITIRTSNPLHIIFSNVESGAELTNLKIKGTVKVNVTRQKPDDKAAITNMTEQDDGTFVAHDSWLGGESFGSNQDFTQQYGEGLDLKLFIDRQEATII